MGEKILHINGKEFKKIVLESPIPVIVDFYSEECAPCEVLSPIYEKMAEKYGQYIRFVKILRLENLNLAKSINVSSSPTILFYKDGVEVGRRLNGFMNKPQVRKAIEEAFEYALPKEEMKRVDCDILVLGAGAAGLSSAIYAARSKMNTVVIDENIPGGLTATTYHVENYPGSQGRIKGKQLIQNMCEQAKFFGARIDDLKEVFKVNLTGKIKYVLTEDTEYYAKAIIIASGTRPKLLSAENADKFKGRGIHYCATCDGPMYEDGEIVVVGGGNSAVEEAVFLTRFATHVTIVHQFDKFQASQIAQEEAFKNEKISVVWDSEVRKVEGDSICLKNVTIENLKTKKLYEIPAEAAFVYIGMEPASKLYKGQLDIDKNGYIIAAEDTQTSVRGVFVAGDVRTKPIRQIVTAASDGAVAGIMAEKYLSGNN